MFKKIAHNTTIPAFGVNKDLRPLQDLITAEKGVLGSLQKLSVDYSKASEALRTWGLNEGDDLGDILSASTSILSHFSSALLQYATHVQNMRDQFKAIRTKEECLDDLKRRRRAIHRKAEDADKKLTRIPPDNKNYPPQRDLLNRLRQEIRMMDSEIMSEESALGDFKRTATKLCLGLKFGGLLECCEKGVIVGQYGKSTVAEISEETTQPGMPRSLYLAHNKVEGLVADAHRHVNAVTLSTVPSAGSPDRRQYNEDSSNAPAAFYLATQTGYRNPSNTGLPLFPSEPQPPQTGYRNPSNSGLPLFPGEPQPPQTLPDDNASYLQAIRPFGGNGYTPEKPDPSFAPSSRNQLYSPPYESQLFQGSANPTFSQTMPPPSQQPEVNASAVDDFGVNVHSNSPIDSSTTSAGRFATFPVKTRSSGYFGGYSLLDPPLLDGRPIVGDSSLSKSIEEALQEKEGPNPESWTAPPIMGRSESSLAPKGKIRASEGSYDRITNHRGDHSDDDPPPFEMTLSASATVPPFPVDKKERFEDQSSTLHPPSENNETLLAYMNDSASQNSSPVAGSFSGTDEDGRRVRFGSMTGVSQENQKRVSPEREQVGNTSAVGTSLTEGPNKGPEDSPGNAETSQNKNNYPFNQAKPTTWVINNRDDDPLPQVKPTLSRVPPPSIPVEEDEKTLNAAAAHEISLELEALKNNSQNRPPSPVDQGIQSDTTPDVDGGAVPTPLFNNQPPHPYAGLNPAAQPFQPPLQQQQQQQDMRTNLPPRFQALNNYNLPVQSQVPPRFQGSSPTIVNSLPPRFQTSYTTQVSTPGGIDQERGDSILPPINPRPLGSTPPLNIDAGTRTIHAAAFKRPIQRKGASADGDAMAGKKTLPSLPYPVAASPADALTVQGNNEMGDNISPNVNTTEGKF